MKAGKITEPSAYVELGGYVHSDAGRAKTKLYVGDVNTPLKVDDAAITKRLKKIRVTMNVTEDTTPRENCVYEKKVWMEQESSDGGAPTNGQGQTASEGNYEPQAAPGAENGQTPLWVLKNWVKKISSAQTLMWLAMIGIAILAAFALALNLK